MGKNLVTEAERYLSSWHKNKRRSQVLRIVGVLVVFATIYALILPAVTMSNEVECGMVEHIHTESCWEEQLVWPQPQLVCAVESSGALVLHTHDSYCYNEQGELICTLPEVEAHVHGPECYQEQRTLICGEVADPGHQHTASCYTYVRVESTDAASAGGYTCGFQEGEGAHVHTEECYPQERAAEPLCGLEETADEYDEQGNLIRQGHTHTEECWLVRVHEKLICGQEETEDVYDEEGNLVQQGHRHTSSCWLTGDELCYQYGCGQHESAGHVHTAACGQESSVQTDAQGELWEQVLICGEEEREPGHVHTDECYDINQVLTCHKQELEPHTHDAGCYDENGVLICGKTEILVHQHTSECFVTPEGGQELTRVLICGIEEHTHTEECYVKFTPKDEEVYYCGLQEHVHTMPDCYFESGELKCTLTEHVHDLSCLQPPVEESEEPEESQPPDVPAAEGVELTNAEFTYTNEAFAMTFTVNGFAQVADGQTEPAQPQSSWPGGDPAPSPSGGDLVEITNQMVPLAALPRMMSFAMPDVSEAPPTTNEYEVNGTTAPGLDTEPGGTAVINSSQPDLPDFDQIESLAPAPTATFAVAGSSEETVEFCVEVLEENDPRYLALLDAVGDVGEEDDTILRQGLRLTCSWMGKEMDLSQCEIAVTVKPSQALLQAVNQDEEGLMAAVEEGAAFENAGDQDDEERAKSALTLYTARNMTTVALDAESGTEPESEPMLLSGDSEVLVDVSKQVFPTFTVEYVAKLDTVERNDDGTVEGYDALTVIDTEKSGSTPKNGDSGTQQTSYMYASTEDGSVLMKSGVQPIYKTHIFNYETANLMKHIDVVTTMNNEFGTAGSEHYDLKKIHVTYPNEDGTTIEKEYDYNSSLQLTNREDTANTKQNFIWIKEGAVLQLIYEPKKTTVNQSATFYDYDVSDGEIYTSKNNAVNQTNGRSTSLQADLEASGTTLYAQVYKQGINSGDYGADGTHARLAFGNSESVLPTGWGDQSWKGNTLNRSNSKINTSGCTFGLVTGLNDNGNEVIYAEGVVGPSLFGGSDNTAWKTKVTNVNQLEFDRSGDTYTLTAVPNTNVSNLDRFSSMLNYSKTGMIYYNNFWPVDAAASWGTDGHDLKFGDLEKYNGKKRQGVGADGTAYTMPKADANVDHNAYFGMTFEVKFNLADDYIGPLEYYFFGDDDMWVFLDGELVCDIGGVHSAVGEYVNLWDYIIGRDPKNYEAVDCTEGVLSTTLTYEEHKLTFFYTERGASGSTCWMQYTLPSVTYSSYKVPGTEGALCIEKEVEGTPTDAEFEFELVLTDGSGAFHNDLLKASFYKVGTNGASEKVDVVVDPTTPIKLKLSNGQAYLITGLPMGTKYTLTEIDSKGYNPAFQVSTYEGSANGTLDGIQYYDLGIATIDGQIRGGEYIVAKCINSAPYALPETGGASPQWYTMAGVPLTAAMFCLWYKKKNRGEGAEDGA